jgi:hypothetical protein
MEHLITKRFLFFLTPLFIIIGLAISGCYYDNEEVLYKYSQTPCDTNVFSYSQKVEPILRAYCYTCHSQTSPSSGIAIEGYTTLLTYVNNHKLWGTIDHLSGYSAMPQNANKLNECNLTIIKKWIDAGAPNN